MPISPGAEVFDEESGELYLSFDCNTMVEMKERNVDHPYVYRTLANSTVYSTKVIFSFLHSKIHDFLEAIAPLWSLAHKKNVLNKIDEEHFLAPVLEPRHTDVFDARFMPIELLPVDHFILAYWPTLENALFFLSAS
ncbi:unnamed protein product [Aphanomyces euteiches]